MSFEETLDLIRETIVKQYNCLPITDDELMKTIPALRSLESFVKLLGMEYHFFYLALMKNCTSLENFARARGLPLSN